jgi:hypothetical protein
LTFENASNFVNERERKRGGERESESERERVSKGEGEKSLRKISINIIHGLITQLERDLPHFS